jgi:hypothetical protein
MSQYNFVNLLFRTNPESDIQSYEIHRSKRCGFSPSSQTLIGLADANAVVKGSHEYGHVPVDHNVREYDHMMYADETVLPSSIYYYRVCAVDAAGQRGPCSDEAEVQTEGYRQTPATAVAQSNWSATFDVEAAIDGDTGFGWVSAPYGGGSAAAPRDTWLEVRLPRSVKLKGIALVGLSGKGTPPGRVVKVEYQADRTWRTASGPAAVPTEQTRFTFSNIVETDTLRISTSAAGPWAPDGAVRIAEVLVILPDGTEMTIPQLISQW